MSTRHGVHAETREPLVSRPATSFSPRETCYTARRRVRLPPSLARYVRASARRTLRLMFSPEATRDVAARPAPGAGERELKYTLPSGRVHLARQRLETVCRRDPEYPAAV